ncbi:MAG: D-2-hydroxyacid dehydrogenase [Verrucomicrobia bacterium]|nr:MAG: D-2-hydroxyacid dehydrogenase [Verrucomicrobiota bacterium]
MHLVILDGHTLNPGDLSWDGVRRLVSSCEIHDRTPAAQIRSRASRADLILTNKCPLTAETIAALPRLRYIGVLATGYNVVDTEAARDRGIIVTNVPDYGTRAVAQHVFALILSLANKVEAHSRAVRAGRWSAHPDFCFWDGAITELAGLTLGIIGYGRIGRAVAGIARAFGLQVIVHSRSRPPGEESVSLETLLRRSDIVSLHCPLTPETSGMIDAGRLAMMKPTAWLINTARGPLVDETALAAALDAGTIAGAALDVLGAEPPPDDHPLLAAPNCLITPHMAWAARAARQRLLSTVEENLRAFLAGNPVNVVNR